MLSVDDLRGIALRHGIRRRLRAAPVEPGPARAGLEAAYYQFDPEADVAALLAEVRRLRRRARPWRSPVAPASPAHSA